MFKAIKECMKNWLMAHERLYWYIVIGLAVFGFGLMTAIGCAKLYDANAAEKSRVQTVEVDVLGSDVSFDVWDIRDCDWSYWLSDMSQSSVSCLNYTEPEKLIECIVENTSNMCVIAHDSSVSSNINKVNYVFGDNIFSRFDLFAGTDLYGFYNTADVYCVKVDYSYEIPRVYAVNGGSEYLYPHFDSYEILYLKNGNLVLGSTYDIFVDVANPVLILPVPCENLMHPEEIKEIVFSSDGTYLGFKNRQWHNAFFMDSNFNFENSFFRFDYDFKNAPEETFLKREVQFTGYVYLPSKELIDKVWEDYCDKNLSSYAKMNTGEYYSEWLQLLENENNVVGKKFPVKFTIECSSDVLTLKLTHEDIIASIEACSGTTIKEYYDLTGTRETVLTNLILSHIWVSRLDGIVYTTFDDVIEYGPLVSVSFFASMDPVVYEAVGDPLFVGPGIDLDSDVNASVNQAFKDALQEALKDNENSNMNLDDAFGDLSGSGLWDGFKGLAGGLSSLGPSLTSIGSLVGSVFSFIPAPVSGIFTFTFFAICIIAIIKAIRG